MLDNGKIVRIIINHLKRIIVAPTYTIRGNSGEDAEISLEIDNAGQVITATVLNPRAKL